MLWLPEEGFEGPWESWRSGLDEAWGGRAVATLPAELRAPLVVLISGEPPGQFGSRLRRLASDERLRGRLLAVWCLSGEVREDLPASLLAEGLLSGVGLAENTLVARREAVRTVGSLRTALDSGARRAERLPGPFLWHF